MWTGDSPIDVEIRLMDESDIGVVECLETRSFEAPWSANKLVQYIHDGLKRSITAKINDIPLGYAAYELVEVVELHRIAVTPEARRHAIGKQLLEYIIDCYTPTDFHVIQAIVPDNNLDAHLFLKSCDFKAVPPYIDGDEYVMERDIRSVS